MLYISTTNHRIQPQKYLNLAILGAPSCKPIEDLGCGCAPKGTNFRSPPPSPELVQLSGRCPASRHLGAWRDEVLVASGYLLHTL